MVEANPEALINDRAIPFQPDADVDALLGRKKMKSWFAFFEIRFERDGAPIYILFEQKGWPDE